MYSRKDFRSMSPAASCVRNLLKKKTRNEREISIRDGDCAVCRCAKGDGKESARRSISRRTWSGNDFQLQPALDGQGSKCERLCRLELSGIGGALLRLVRSNDARFCTHQSRALLARSFHLARRQRDEPFSLLGRRFRRTHLVQQGCASTAAIVDGGHGGNLWKTVCGFARVVLQDCVLRG